MILLPKLRKTHQLSMLNLKDRNYQSGISVLLICNNSIRTIKLMILSLIGFLILGLLILLKMMKKYDIIYTGT